MIKISFIYNRRSKRETLINVIKIILFPLKDIHVYMHTGEKPHKIRNRVSIKLMSGDVKTIHVPCLKYEYVENIMTK